MRSQLWEDPALCWHPNGEALPDQLRDQGQILERGGGKLITHGQKAACYCAPGARSNCNGFRDHRPLPISVALQACKEITHNR